MFVVYIFAALSIPALVVAQGNQTTTPNGLPIPSSTTKTVIECNGEQLKLIQEKWFDVLRCYKDVINHHLRSDNGKRCNEVDDMKKYMNEFLNSTQCYKREQTINGSLNMFYNLVQFTLTNSSFKDFVKSNGSHCISTTRANVSSCISREDVRNHTAFHYSYWVALKLGSRPGCESMGNLKSCIIKSLKANTLHCREGHIKFVDSLIDFVTKTSCDDLPNEAGKGSADALLSTSQMMYLSTLAILTLI